MLHVTPATLWQFVIRPKKFSRTNGPFVIVDVTVFIREKKKKKLPSAICPAGEKYVYSNGIIVTHCVVFLGVKCHLYKCHFILY